MKAKSSRVLHPCCVCVLAVYVLAAAFDPSEVTNAEYLQFVQATHRSAPEYWIHGRFPTGRGTEPVVLVNFDEAESYCRFVGKRLPTVEEWRSTCEAGKLKKRGDIWEWTSTEVDIGGRTYMALCGPANTCDCSHRYLPQWKNSVKGFRCVQVATPVT